LHTPAKHCVVARKRDETILVLGLPMVYGLMAFKAVVHMWQVVTNHSLGIESNKNWVERKDFLFRMYESAFMVGDVYESAALYVFAYITLRVIKRQVKDIVTKANEAASRSSLKTQATERELGVTTHDLMENLAAETISGIMYFCVSCIVQAAYTLIVTGAAYYNHPIWSLSSPSTASKAHYFFLGMGTVASCAAIQNIITIEHSFGEKFLGSFSPNKKFWSAKVLVSIAFIQTLLLDLPPFNAWPKTKQNLLYSSMICFECFLIALFHCIAWYHSETWYVEYEKRRQSQSIAQPLLAGAESAP